MSEAIRYLQKRNQRRWPSGHLFVFVRPQRDADHVSLCQIVDPGAARGHKFQELATDGATTYFAWRYPGLVGSPPVLRLPGSVAFAERWRPSIVAGSVLELLWQWVSIPPEHDWIRPQLVALEAALLAEVGPRPPADTRVHPSFAPFQFVPPPQGPTILEAAVVLRAQGKLDEAVAVLDGGRLAEYRSRAMAWLLAAGRSEEAWRRLPAVAERLVLDHDEHFDDLPAEVVDPFRVAADRQVRAWAEGLTTIRKARASPRGKRDRLAILATVHRKAAIGQLAIAAAVAESHWMEDDLPTARRMLDELRASPLAADVEDDLAALERAMTRGVGRRARRDP